MSELLQQRELETPELLSRDELRARLMEIGEERYHHRHPFHLVMHDGLLTAGQLQAWALNRYYYQSRIPIKDAIILSRSDDMDFRRAWRQRIIDHDGDNGNPGSAGIDRWIRLAEASGLERQRVIDCREVLPGVRYAVDSYLALVSNGSLLEAVASSLTEMFAGKLIALRMDRIRKHYPWLSDGLGYFENRISQAPRDAEFAFEYVIAHAPTRAEQELAISALVRKCELLWAQLDAIHFAYVQPGWPPPGAFRP
ncbi:MAG: Pyrroloquinoline-quinone synthase [Acidobacteriaceae bacterium]|nr:Pyrroloquinoline-quinone synthase [Acidobacteriaceae bacterium]